MYEQLKDLRKGDIVIEEPYYNDEFEVIEDSQAITYQGSFGILCKVKNIKTGAYDEWFESMPYLGQLSIVKVGRK